MARCPTDGFRTDVGKTGSCRADLAHPQVYDLSTMSIHILDKVVFKVRSLAQRKVRCFALANSLIQDKIGLEIGGPSEIFGRKWMPLYPSIRQLDNCNFSEQNVWAKQASEILRPPGNDFVADGSNLTSVPDSTYEFVLSSHNLEHFANPVKALKEWQRVARPGGTLILAVPNYRYTFDHRRTPTRVEHMLLDFERGTPESDMTHLDEILDKHDLSRDQWAGSHETFRERSLRNFENRCLHHHVFEETNTRELLRAVGMEVLAIETAWPIHIFAIARM